jgi:hypothetical protein
MDIKKDDIHKKSLYKGRVSVPARLNFLPLKAKMRIPADFNFSVRKKSN